VRQRQKVQKVLWRGLTTGNRATGGSTSRLLPDHATLRQPEPWSAQGDVLSELPRDPGERAPDIQPRRSPAAPPGLHRGNDRERAGPVEWSATEVVREPSGENGRERIYLRVLSAKTTNNRSHAIIRTLDITIVGAHRRTAIERFSRVGAAWVRKDVSHDRMDHLKRKFRKVCKNTPEFQIDAYQMTPYNLRHQFIANAKAQYTLIELAALVGHNDVETAAAHYGRRTFSLGPDACPAMPTPVPSGSNLTFGARASPLR
jgi:hypothetical protein